MSGDHILLVGIGCFVGYHFVLFVRTMFKLPKLKKKIKQEKLKFANHEIVKQENKIKLSKFDIILR